jgi:HPt (histidine-containing phosphotransfer) domain-containing protein
MNDYISKPVDERLLYSKIASFLKKQPLSSGTQSIENVEHKRTPLTNLEYLTQRTKSNPQLMTEMIALYLEQTTSLIDAMKHSLQNENWNELQAIAHKMIPSFSIVGMSSDYENLAKKIQEYAGTQQHITEIPGLVSHLTDILVRACKELEETLHSIKNTD